MIEDVGYEILIKFIDGSIVFYDVTGTELDWLYENMRENKGYWNFGDADGEHIINLNNVLEIVSREYEND